MSYSNIPTERQGELLIFAEAVLWSIFPVLTILSYQSITPLVSLAGSLVFAAIFFSILVALRKRWRELVDRSALGDILIATLCIGILFYTLVFIGLEHTSPGNAGILLLLEVFFTHIIFHALRHQPSSPREIVGAILMLVSAVIVLASQYTQFQVGDLLIIVATAIAPIGNLYQQRARKKVSSETILFVRTILTLPVLVLLLLFLDKMPQLSQLQPSLLFFVINGVLLLGISKIMWVEAINRISVSKAITLNSIAPVFTLAIAWLALGQPPALAHLLSVLPMMLGVWLLVGQKT